MRVSGAGIGRPRLLTEVGTGTSTSDILELMEESETVRNCTGIGGTGGGISAARKSRREEGSGYTHGERGGED